MPHHCQPLRIESRGLVCTRAEHWMQPAQTTPSGPDGARSGQRPVTR